MQQDSYRGSAQFPSTLHRYTYSQNASPNLKDPSGNSAYPQTFPDAWYEEWDVHYVSAIRTVWPITGTAGVAVGFVWWEAHLPGTSRSLMGFVTWVGLSIGRLPASVTVSDMKGYSPRRLAGNLSVFDGDAIYLSAGFAWGFFGYGGTLIAIGTFARSGYKPPIGVYDANSAFVSEPRPSGWFQQGFDLGGASFGLGYSVGID